MAKIEQIGVKTPSIIENGIRFNVAEGRGALETNMNLNVGDLITIFL